MKKHLKQLVAGTCLFLFALVGFSGVAAPTPAYAQDSLSSGTVQAASNTEPKVLSPQFLVIPKISAATVVEPVGRTNDGKMKTPNDWRNTGWYQPGIKPGQDGHAVFASHRDWNGNAGPFYRLSDLSAGDNIFVAGDEAIHIYTVTASNDYARTADPSSVIFEQDDSPYITLISCEGNFVDAVDTYDQRRVVQAELTHTFQ